MLIHVLPIMYLPEHSNQYQLVSPIISLFEHNEMQLIISFLSYLGNIVIIISLLNLLLQYQPYFAK